MLSKPAAVFNHRDQLGRPADVDERAATTYPLNFRAGKLPALTTDSYDLSVFD